MRLLNILSLLLAALLAVFTILNWSVLMAPAQLYLGFAEVHAPMGLMLVVAMVAVVVLAVLYILVRQTQVMRELRQSEKELRAQRELADKAEASRFSELKLHLDSLQVQWLQRMDGLQEVILAAQRGSDERWSLRQDQEGRTLAAQLGEIEDKLDRRLGLPGGGKALQDD